MLRVQAGERQRPPTADVSGRDGRSETAARRYSRTLRNDTMAMALSTSSFAGVRVAAKPAAPRAVACKAMVARASAGEDLRKAVRVRRRTRLRPAAALRAAARRARSGRARRAAPG